MLRSVARAYRDAFSGLPRDCWILAGALLVNRAGSMALPFLGLWLTQERGLSLPQTAAVLGSYGCGSVAGSGVGGALSDRLGATRTQLLSLLAGGAGLLWLGALGGFASIAPAAFVVGVALDAFRPAAMADMARRAAPAIQVRGFALLRLAANLGLGVGPALGGLLALYGYRWLFVADALTCWLAALLIHALLPAPAPQAPAPRPGAEAAGSPAPWRDGPFLLLLGLTFLLASVFFQTLSTLPLYLRREYALREDAIGLLLSVNPLIIATCEMVLVHWAERFRPLRLVGLGALLICAGFGLLALRGPLAWLLLALVVWTVGEMLALPQLNTLVAARAGPGRHGRYIGAYSMAFALAFAVAPAAGTWALGRFGPRALWLGLGALGPLLWALALMLERRGALAPAAGAARSGAC
jgi:predicted MFS family arabinose efflux permease